jgi:hypothetical protein
MKFGRALGAVLGLIALGAFVENSQSGAKSKDVCERIRQSLDQAGLSAVKVSENGSGAVVIAGEVLTNQDEWLAESIAKSTAKDQTIFDEISVMWPDKLLVKAE